jgi:hypothetical protein
MARKYNADYYNGLNIHGFIEDEFEQIDDSFYYNLLNIIKQANKNYYSQNITEEEMALKISYAAVLGEKTKLLQHYIDIFNEVPSGSHMVRAYTYMEQIFMSKFERSELTIDEKQIERFDKLKSLALGNSNINERKLAFYRSAKTWSKMTGIELKYPEDGE